MFRVHCEKLFLNYVTYGLLFTIVIYCVNVRIDSNFSKFVVPVFIPDHSDSL